MRFEDALAWVESTLIARTNKPLTLPEKEILRAAWDNKTYSHVAESLYLSVGHIKDLASLLWKRLSPVLGEKITKKNLRRVISEHCATLTHTPTPIAPREPDDPEDVKGNILIVDDLVENLRFLTDILTENGYKARSVTNGKMALRTVANNPPDAILLDIKMPDINGYKVCSTLKADEGTAEIPIIFLSALNEVFDKVKAFKVGGVDYITQPFQPEEVIARIHTHLTIQQQKQQLRQMWQLVLNC